MPINLQSLLTPAIARRWEFALSEPGYEIRFGRAQSCPGCGEQHQRVFLETMWNDEETDHPERAIVISVLQPDGDAMLFIDHFENGERQVRAEFRVDSLRDFFAGAAEDVAESLRALRRVSYLKTVSPLVSDAAVCLN